MESLAQVTAHLDRPTLRRAVRCSLLNVHSQWGEDVALLPTLLGAAGARPGTFVEIGAYTGVEFSNTVMLERCWNWTGVLIEANPANYQQLNLTQRPRSAKVHSAVCLAEGRANVTVSGGVTAGVPASETVTHIRARVRAAAAAVAAARMQIQIQIQRAAGANVSQSSTNNDKDKTGVVEVPCAPLSALMARAGLARGATFLSLDVEGSEALVLETAGDLAAFRVIAVELDGADPRKDERVHGMLLAASLEVDPKTIRRPTKRRDGSLRVRPRFATRFYTRRDAAPLRPPFAVHKSLLSLASPYKALRVWNDEPWTHSAGLLMNLV